MYNGNGVISNMDGRDRGGREALEYGGVWKNAKAAKNRAGADTLEGEGGKKVNGGRGAQ